MLVVDVQVNDWWDRAVLWLQPDEPAAEPVQVDAGTLAEILLLAGTVDADRTNRLFITASSLDCELSSVNIRALLERPDFPMLI